MKVTTLNWLQDLQTLTAGRHSSLKTPSLFPQSILIVIPSSCQILLLHKHKDTTNFHKSFLYPSILILLYPSICFSQDESLKSKPVTRNSDLTNPNLINKSTSRVGSRAVLLPEPWPGSQPGFKPHPLTSDPTVERVSHGSVRDVLLSVFITGTSVTSAHFLVNEDIKNWSDCLY